jgi:hypothetical protein
MAASGRKRTFRLKSPTRPNERPLTANCGSSPRRAGATGGSLSGCCRSALSLTVVAPRFNPTLDDPRLYTPFTQGIPRRLADVMTMNAIHERFNYVADVSAPLSDLLGVSPLRAWNRILDVHTVYFPANVEHSHIRAAVEKPIEVGGQN